MKARYFIPLSLVLISVCSTTVFAQNRSKTGAVFAIWDIYLNEDADHAAFEEFYLDKVIPLEERCMPGLEVLLVKSDRGTDKGAYKYIWMFESVSDRNAYYPQEGGSGDSDVKGLGSAASEMCNADFEALMENYQSFYDIEKYQSLTSPAYNDLVVIEKAN